MKKLPVFITTILLVFSMTSCFVPYNPQSGDTSADTIVETKEDEALIYLIELQNVISEQYYPLDVGETFYLYVKPYVLDNGHVLQNDDISLMSLHEGDAIKVEFLMICENGAFLYKITTLKEGNCDLFAIDRYKRIESLRINLSIRDYKNMDIKYRITDIDNVFHKPHCEIYSKIDLHKRHVINLDRKTLRSRGYTPCEKCCG